MVKLTITGKGDKRIFAYPLMKVLALTGKTCIITDDIAYSRMFRAGTGKYEMDIELKKKKRTGKLYENMEVQIIPDMDMCNMIAQKKEEEGFDFVLFITDTSLPESNKYLVVASLKMDFMGIKVDEFLSLNEDKSIKMAVISSLALPKKQWQAQGITTFMWNENRMLYPYKVEEGRKLIELKDSEIMLFLADTFASTMGLKPVDFLKAEKWELK